MSRGLGQRARFGRFLFPLPCGIGQRAWDDRLSAAENPWKRPSSLELAEVFVRLDESLEIRPDGEMHIVD